MKSSRLLFWLCINIFVIGSNRETPKASSASQIQNNTTNESVENALNLQRTELALRPIGKSWVLYRSEPGQDDWKIRGDGFPAKSVFKDAAGKTVSEEDYYYSGAEFTDSEGHDWERITVHFDYGSKEMILSYTGTNKTTEATLSKFLMTLHGPTTNITGVIGLVKAATAGWPDAPK